MIRNNNQLKYSKDVLSQIKNQISETREKFVNDEMLDIYILPLIEQQVQLEQEIEEYLFLRDQHTDEGIKYLKQNPSLLDNIGELLSKLRISNKITQSELAKQLGWEQSNLSRFESEKYNSQTVRKIVEYTSKLGICLKVFPSQDTEDEDEDDIAISNFFTPKEISWGISPKEDTATTTSVTRITSAIH